MEEHIFHPLAQVAAIMDPDRWCNRLWGGSRLVAQRPPCWGCDVRGGRCSQSPRVHV